MTAYADISLGAWHMALLRGAVAATSRLLTYDIVVWFFNAPCEHIRITAVKQNVWFARLRLL